MMSNVLFKIIFQILLCAFNFTFFKTKVVSANGQRILLTTEVHDFGP